MEESDRGVLIQTNVDTNVDVGLVGSEVVEGAEDFMDSHQRETTIRHYL